MRWMEFKGPDGELPPERRDVLVKLNTEVNETGAVVVGYLRYAGGDKYCPYFVCSGIPGKWQVTHWCDCLGDNFIAPGWRLTNASKKS